MTTVIAVVLACVSTPIVIALGLLNVGALAALVGKRRAQSITGEPGPFTVLVPAHNEALGIERTLKGIRCQLRAEDHVVVVADNCSDATAEIARGCGADVVVRVDPERRGKGFALSAGFSHIRQHYPSTAIILDADCMISADCLRTLASCSEQGRPAQALDLMISPEQGSGYSRLLAFFWAIKNDLRPSGFQALGLPCHLMGTGMALPYSLWSSFDFESGHLAEDLLFEVQLARKQIFAIFCPSAVVTSIFPDSADACRKQRTRWVHGHLDVARHYAMPLLWAGLRQRNASMALLALDLLVPPLSLLVMATTVLVMANALAFSLGGGALPLLSAAWLAGGLASFLATAWIYCGRPSFSLRDGTMVVRHAASVVGSAIHFSLGRHATWTRTERG